MLTLLRVVWTVTAVSAAAAAVLGWYALHRSKGARLALSVLAVPLFVTSFFFVGLPGAQRRPGDGDRGDRDAVVPAGPGLVRRHRARGARAAAPAARPPPTAPTGRDPLLDLPPPTAPPLHPTPYAAAAARLASPHAAPGDPRRSRGPACWRGCPRPRCSGCCGLVLVVMLASPDAPDRRRTPREPRPRQPGADRRRPEGEHLRRCARWSWRGRQRPLRSPCSRGAGSGWAATGLAVSAGLASVLCLLSVVGSLVVMLVPLAACAATVALLLRPESLAWFRARRPA